MSYPGPEQWMCENDSNGEQEPPGESAERAEARVAELEHALLLARSTVGQPDPAAGCRQVIRIADRALAAVRQEKP
jgi:hypothetical protein